MVIVRAAYGQSVDSVQQMVSIHFAEQASQQASISADASNIRGTANSGTSRVRNGDPEAGVDTPQKTEGGE